MPTTTAAQFRRLSEDRLTDCRILLDAGRYDAVMYLSGYILEFALKARVCDTLGWVGFPQRRETGYQLVRPMMTHDLNLLLHYSGRETLVLSQFPSEWNGIAKDWDPENRYDPHQNNDRAKTERRLDDIAKIRRAL